MYLHIIKVKRKERKRDRKTEKERERQADILTDSDRGQDSKVFFTNSHFPVAISIHVPLIYALKNCVSKLNAGIFQIQMEESIYIHD